MVKITNSKTKKDWRRMEYNVPITEYLLTNENEFLIKGTAINDCTTRNGITYTAEELRPAAPSLKGRPILKDHDNRVEAIVGKVINSSYDAINKCVLFEGVIKNPEIENLITQGLLSTVSIGAMVNNIDKSIENDEEKYTAKGINFVELSLVAVPADPNAGFEQAMMESFNIKESEEEDDSDENQTDKTESEGTSSEVSKEIISEEEKIIGGENKMAEEVTKALEEKARVLEEQNERIQKELETFKEKEMNSLREAYKALTVEKGVSAKEGFEKLSREVLEAMIDTLKSLKSMEMPKETKTETKKDETKGLVLEKVEKAFSGIKFERSKFGKGVSFYSENLGEKHPAYAR